MKRAAVAPPALFARRERALALVVALFAFGALAVVLDARARGAGDEAAACVRVTTTTGLSDLALSSSSRWLRHPSLAEPNAALWDAPLGLDVDPAGAAIRRPRTHGTAR